MHPVYRHRAGDLRSFRLTLAQLVDSGACRPSEAIKDVLLVGKRFFEEVIDMFAADGVVALSESFLGTRVVDREHP